VKSATAFLTINGGSNGRPAPRGPEPLLGSLAARTQTVMADLRMVPNEPLTFQGESRSRTEDEIIAYTWDKYLRMGDENWPLRLPMTKSAVRAMDTVTAFCAERGNAVVDKFFVAGGSKRGWTTWTTAAVDDRVVAIAPFVIDALNLEKSMEHHYRKALMKIEDPYAYRDRLTMPKLIVNSTGDQYFLPDSSQFYFDELKGEKHLRYVPNTKHNLANSDALVTVRAFYESIIQDTPRPRYSWKFEGDESITATVVDEPTEVKLWQAHNPKARDFRLDTIGPAFKSSPIEPAENGRYRAKVQKPSEGWTAFFVEMTFPGPGELTFKFTSGVRVTPDTLPSEAPPKKRP
jgi:PhoPQ-activated pathogenicity-related protein